jgi:RHS repeat-associated protein
MTTLTDSLTGPFAFGYDTLSRRISLNRPNGINTSYSYDSRSRLLSVLHKSGSTTLDGASYAYDNAGNRTAKTNQLNNITEQYVYDALYQLTQVSQGSTTAENYSYDPVGNRLSSLNVPTYSYNSSNELTSTPNVSFTYDNNGNTMSKTNSGATTQYTWDFENRLSSVILPGSGGTVTFKYDPFGRRIQKSSPRGITNYFYDEDNAIQEISTTGALLARYTQGQGLDEPLAQLRSGTISYYEQDGLGSVTSLSNTSSLLANTYIYDSFGNLTVSSGTIVNPFQYTGRDYDQKTGLRYYRARYYDPQIGHFLSEDPIGFGGGMNFYDYVGNQVTGLVDPSGLSGSHPGGPYHPPVGVHTACLPTDTCSVITGKLWLLTRMITSHTGWDRKMAPPREGGRHAGELAQLWVQCAVCYNLYLQKCQLTCPRPITAPQPRPRPSPQPYAIPIIDPLANWLNEKLGYPFKGSAWDKVRELQKDIERGPPVPPGWRPNPGGGPIPSPGPIPVLP